MNKYLVQLSTDEYGCVTELNNRIIACGTRDYCLRIIKTCFLVLDTNFTQKLYIRNCQTRLVESLVIP